MNLICVGIDFSINSPAICIYNDAKKSYKFVSFTNIQDKIISNKVPKAYEIHHNLLTNNIIDWIHFNRRRKHDNYTVDQFQKIEDACTLANSISQYISDELTPKCTLEIGIEGYSYGSKGNSFIDLITFNSTLRSKLYERFVLHRKCEDIKVFSPSQIKGWAGKGNANKIAMWNYFINNSKNDKELENNLFWNWCTKKDIKTNGKGEIELEKPLDDIVDSYFIANLLKQLHISNP